MLTLSRIQSISQQFVLSLSRQYVRYTTPIRGDRYGGMARARTETHGWRSEDKGEEWKKKILFRRFTLVFGNTAYAEPLKYCGPRCVFRVFFFQFVAFKLIFPRLIRLDSVFNVIVGYAKITCFVILYVSGVWVLASPEKNKLDHHLALQPIPDTLHRLNVRWHRIA